jgi:hypothetical protein
MADDGLWQTTVAAKLNRSENFMQPEKFVGRGEQMTPTPNRSTIKPFGYCAGLQLTEF